MRIGGLAKMEQQLEQRSLSLDSEKWPAHASRHGSSSRLPPLVKGFAFRRLLQKRQE